MNWIRLIGCILGCELAGIIGSIFTFSSISTWYALLEKPFFTPPAWVFGPAWTILYALMGIALYLVWEKGITPKAMEFFGIQLTLNIVWSVLFFGLKNPLLAFIEIIGLWISILVTIIEFQRISSKAAWLLAPYLGWVTFAAVLNFFVWQLNP